ncbi:MAG: HAD hydrolase family protein, partial [Deltaproteobacteria bacterium]
MKTINDDQVKERLKGIRLLVLDVDGVLTDGTIRLSQSGEEIKVFHVRDGYGLKLLMDNGVEVAIISGRTSSVVETRAAELGIREVYQGVKRKEAVCRELLDKRGLREQEVASVGDDLPDRALFACSGVRIAVADAAEELLEAADAITDKKGGDGAVR